MKVKLFLDRLLTELLPFYPSQEAQQLLFLLFENRFQLTRNQWIINERVFSEADYQIILPDLKRLQNHEPIQYILNETYFYERKFYTTPDVLIPRIETEELIQYILKQINTNHQKNTKLHILDIGTGSGCIPITLFHELTHKKIDCDVYALDISASALKIAQKNAKELKANIQFYQLDILKNDLSQLPDFDIIISNPPYVRELEKTKMQANVLNYEPAIALFVPNDNPLLFYEHITKLANQKLKQEGKLYFEINEDFGKETQEILEKYYFHTIHIQEDLHGKNRFVWGQK